MGVVLKSKRKIVAELNPPTGVNILGVEVTQAIQNFANQIQLIRGQATVVRGYLDASALSSGQRIREEISVPPTSGAPAQYVDSSNTTVGAS